MSPPTAFCAAGAGLPLAAPRHARRGLTMGTRPEAASPPPAPVTRRSTLLAAAAAVAAAAAAGGAPPPAEAISIARLMKKAGPEQTMENGIRYREVIIGKGFEPNSGDTVAIHYSLYCGDIEVESSRESQGLAASPLGFTYGAEAGAGAVLKGINLGTFGSREGKKQGVLGGGLGCMPTRAATMHVPRRAGALHALRFLRTVRGLELVTDARDTSLCSTTCYRSAHATPPVVVLLAHRHGWHEGGRPAAAGGPP